MNPSTLRRKIIVLLVGSALVASAVAAADLRSPAFPLPLRLLSQGTPELLERFARLLGFLWEKEGCGIDPYGLCRNGQSTGENGPGLDPYGQSTGAVEAGPGLDPYGGH